MTYNSSKANGWCINHNHKYFESSKSAPFIGSLQAINISRQCQQYINYCCRSNRLYCCSLCLHNSAATSFLLQICFHSTFKQKIGICMHMCTHGCQMMVTETVKQPTLGLFLFCSRHALNFLKLFLCRYLYVCICVCVCSWCY